MSVQEQAPSSSFDAIKWILALVALAGAVYANHALVDDSVLIRVGVILALILVGLGVGFSTTKGKAGLAFAKESKVEARKVVWPTRPETVQTTIIIVIAVSLISVLLYLIDMGLVALINFLTVKG
jgi:preprotein translocase subunit SecE